MTLRRLADIGIRVGACVLVFGGDLFQLWRERRREVRGRVELTVTGAEQVPRAERMW